MTRGAEDVVLIPAYNEEGTIREIVSKTKKLGISPIVIDDCSSDRTGEFAKKAGAFVIRQKSNLGKGEALKSGLNYVFSNAPTANTITFIDADMQYDPKDALNLVVPINDGKADLVIGYRDWSTVPLRHRIGNFVWRQTFNILFGTKLKDTNCGLMSLSMKSAKVLIHSIGGGYIIENAILAEAVRRKLRIGQVKVDVDYKEKSRMARGIRMVLGITLYILIKGFQYRMSSNNRRKA
jgi:glycosyltransferase involved in cell wall biosynthesis